jgi:hypothetical protein
LRVISSVKSRIEAAAFVAVVALMVALALAG